MTKVLMFGWEFPPFNSGGLGTACYGLTRALSKQGAQITFVVPHASESKHDFLKIISSDMAKVKFRGIRSLIQGYMTSEQYDSRYARVGKSDRNFDIYGKNLFEEVERYAGKAAELAQDEEHDVIHAHDWMTFKAGMAAKKATGKPLVLHVHATEFDRTGGHGVNQYVYDIERAGMHFADRVIAVSNYTRNKIVEHYGVNPDKVSVVHNAIDLAGEPSYDGRKSKTILYLGRVTLQKGPDYFIEAARKVLEKEPHARFLIAGTGDMEHSIIQRAAELGISDRVLFTGFLRENDITKAYQMASLYVMPSVSEPFGLTPLEAAGTKTPVLISKQSGVSEIFANCLKVDFWDINQMANKMIAVLRHQELGESLSANAYSEISTMSWDKSASKVMNIYGELI